MKSPEISEIFLDSEIKNIYNEKIKKIEFYASRDEKSRCFESIDDLWGFMNRFRNCNIGFLFDERVHCAIRNLNKRAFNVKAKNKSGRRIRMGIVFSRFLDAGGVSFPHRLILEQEDCKSLGIEQYVACMNAGDAEENNQKERYNYLNKYCDVKEIKLFSKNTKTLEKAEELENWLLEKKIDILLMQSEVCTIYAAASKPAPVIAMISPDYHTFTLGPGVGDFTVLVMSEQAHTYKENNYVHESKFLNIKLPLPPQSYVDKISSISKKQLGLRESDILSVTTNIWKCATGDDFSLLECIRELMDEHANYHHAFLGTSRSLDHVEAYIQQYPAIRNRFHFFDIQKNTYEIFKTADFFVNSYPVSGASNTEIAQCGKPSINLVSHQTLTAHSREFLQVFDCEVYNKEEFLRLGNRFILDEDFRNLIGNKCKTAVSNNLEKSHVCRERLIKPLIQRYKKGNDPCDNAGLEFQKTLRYEKGMALYLSKEANKWESEKKQKLLWDILCESPDRPFAWIKLIEQAILEEDRELIALINRKIKKTKVIRDYRIQLMMICERYSRGLRSRDDRYTLREICKNVVFDKKPKILEEIENAVKNDYDLKKLIKEGVPYYYDY